MHKPIETSTETAGFDEQTRSLYSLGAFADREKGSVLGQLYDYWRALPRGPYGLPHTDICLPKTALPQNFADQICCLDTRADNPLDYIIRDHAASPIPGFGSDLVGKPLCDRPTLEMDTPACAVEFLYCKHERTPMYHEIEQILGGLKRHYTRIMVPVEGDLGDVARIFFAMRELQPAKRETFHFIEEI